MKRQMFICFALMTLEYAVPATAGGIARHSFGATPDGQAVQAITLTNRRGMSATVITYGAALQSLVMPDARGRKADVALGHATLAEYIDKRQFMGATVGRVANRIGSARFALDGQTYRITANDGPNALHGGVSGFDRSVWEVIEVSSGRDFAEVVMRHVSPDGDQGFPGNVTTTVRYRLDGHNALTIGYTATTDRATVVSLSSHAYWNLAGEGSPRGAMGLVLQIPATAYLPVDNMLIPTGEQRSVKGSLFDFRAPRTIGDRVRTAGDEQIRIGRGYDHNWIVTREVTRLPHLMARVTDPTSGRSMELWSDQPGLQFYSGNFLDSTTRGKSGQFYRQGDAIVLEPQAFPDAVNQPSFGSVRLIPGQIYKNTIIYRFTTRSVTPGHHAIGRAAKPSSGKQE